MNASITMKKSAVCRKKPCGDAVFIPVIDWVSLNVWGFAIRKNMRAE